MSPSGGVGPKEADGQSLGSLTRMAFCYEKPTMGAPGTGGAVLVADVSPVTVVSMAVRGEYTPDRFAPPLEHWGDDRPITPTDMPPSASQACLFIVAR